MALTQEKWFQKLKSFVPSWFYEQSDGVNEAVLYAMAKVFYEAQVSAESELTQTFITQAIGSYLDLMGDERGISRYSGESDEFYSERIRYLLNSTSKDTLERVVKAALNNGDPIFIENIEHGFADDELFADCNDSRYLSKTKQYNRFTVVIPEQDVVDHSEIKEMIVNGLDRNKALGVFYDVAYGEEF